MTEKLDVSMVSLRAILHAVTPRLDHGTPAGGRMSTPQRWDNEYFTNDQTAACDVCNLQTGIHPT